MVAQRQPMKYKKNKLYTDEEARKPRECSRSYMELIHIHLCVPVHHKLTLQPATASTATSPRNSPTVTQTVKKFARHTAPAFSFICLFVCLCAANYYCYVIYEEYTIVWGPCDTTCIECSYARLVEVVPSNNNFRHRITYYIWTCYSEDNPIFLLHEHIISKIVRCSKRALFQCDVTRLRVDATYESRYENNNLISRDTERVRQRGEHSRTHSLASSDCLLPIQEIKYFSLRCAPVDRRRLVLLTIV
ncbi:unnamed protein product [Spodoptera littoralis]|uniref:Uncharacterized protein n=1 Tax=Spodoptera littoralis TaxID=7109 RepID=A0A9P0IDA8_SPOLI|nr:unnamed protein product [Spodoptera littoralis]CAH1643811.1 unnamed protein product [Spodoptera littoralis]